jgi:hypothetical protein
MNNFKLIFVSFLILGMITGCSRSSTNWLVPKGTIVPVDHSEKPKDLEYFSPKVDILFVIDNSGSMGEVQGGLRANAYKFANALSQVAILDYHVGVISTDMVKLMESGRLQGIPTYVERTTPNVVDVLSNKMVLGTDGSAVEMMFSPVMEALSPYLEAGHNKGFYRQDAYLAVIMITDAADQSKVSSQDLLDFLVQKKGDARKVLSYGVIRKLAEERSCDGQESLDTKLEVFLASVVNGSHNQENVLSLCSENYGEKLAEFARDIVTRSAGSVKLTAIPNANTIRVAYGTQEIPNDLKAGWTFRASSNTLQFGKDIVWSEQPEGTTLSIDYEILEAP